ncbi:MAG: orotate phosphoribosyltransferase [Thaumarchaeota archaeon]|nr:orotate phosphoribosyltransferase [Nitrososphaerota archaeon]MCH8972685.1 orotate phosphoribosyltransferase [Nitrososphaerota archaeon]
MEFVKEFATFLHEKGAIKFGDFTLSSGKKSFYYVDLRMIASFPHQFRKMIKHLQNQIIEKVGLENFDYIVSIPTGGLVIASSLAFEIVKPLIYVRNKPKEYGTSKSIEGFIELGKKVLMIDDVVTTGGSMINAIESLKEAGIIVSDSFVIINRMEGATESLEAKGVKMHQLMDIFEITKILHEQNLVSNDILESVSKQTGSK